VKQRKIDAGYLKHSAFEKTTNHNSERWWLVVMNGGVKCEDGYYCGTNHERPHRYKITGAEWSSLSMNKLC
jgi:hypothetical protein